LPTTEEIRMQNRLLVLAIALAGVTLAACGDDDSTTPTPVSKILNFRATMNGAGESPNAVTTNATGTFTATLDTSTNVFTWTSTFSGFNANITAGHIHGPFVNGTSGTAGVILNFATVAGSSLTGVGATTGSTSGTVTLNSALQLTTNPAPGINGDSLRKLILANATYVNVHTTANTGGEIRAQLLRVP
jgi:hypothetical protein